MRIAIAHADAPEWVGTLSELVWRVRPKAEIEFTSTLGAVVSTHAGPGTVGFFWFQDDAPPARSRRSRRTGTYSGRSRRKGDESTRRGSRVSPAGRARALAEASERAAPRAAEAPVETLHGVGPALAQRLARLGIEPVGDLLWQRPRRYEGPVPTKRISDLFGDEEAAIEGVVAPRLPGDVGASRS